MIDETTIGAKKTILNTPIAFRFFARMVDTLNARGIIIQKIPAKITAVFFMEFQKSLSPNNFVQLRRPAKLIRATPSQYKKLIEILVKRVATT
jgi:hypothetical protein